MARPVGKRLEIANGSMNLSRLSLAKFIESRLTLPFAAARHIDFRAISGPPKHKHGRSRR
jgi:hypothetical protein